MGKEIVEYLLFFVDKWLFWVGILFLVPELFKHFEKTRQAAERLPHQFFWLLGALCIFIATFQVWHEEHEKVVSQRAYMEIKLDEPWIQPSPGPWRPNQRGQVNFGVQNTGSDAAEWQTSIQELVVKPVPAPLETYTGPDATPTSPALEKEVWEEMLKDRKNKNYDANTYDPGERHWGTAYTSHNLSDDEIDRIVQKGTSMVYLVGLLEWKDGAGIHGRSFCYWLHTPRTSIITEQCETHHAIVENVEQLLPPPKRQL
jgi:hypothetical protein